MKNGWVDGCMKGRKLHFFEGEHFYSVDSQLNWLNLKKLNLMNREQVSIGDCFTPVYIQEQGQNLKLPRRRVTVRAGRWVSRNKEREQMVLCGSYHISGIPCMFSSHQSFTALGQTPGLTSSAPGQVYHIK